MPVTTTILTIDGMNSSSSPLILVRDADFLLAVAAAPDYTSLRGCYCSSRSLRVTVQYRLTKEFATIYFIEANATY